MYNQQKNVVVGSRWMRIFGNHVFVTASSREGPMYNQKIVVRCFWWMMNYWQPRLLGSGRVGRYITNKFLSSVVFGVGLAAQIIGNLIYQWRLVRGTMYNQKVVVVGVWWKRHFSATMLFVAAPARLHV